MTSQENRPTFRWPMPVTIHTPPGGNGEIIPWSELKFNPLGLYHLRRWQGVFPQERGFFVSNQGRFESADIAWFASGMHSDGDHHHLQDHFHSLHNEVHRETKGYPEPKVERKALEKRVHELTFDMATLWDRLTGGTTMILHVPGTMVPGSPPLPEYIKASVYLPPSLVNNHPELHPPILRITQEFLETIGITTVRNWRMRARNDMGYSLSMPGNPQPNGKIYDVPNPKSRSSHYIIPGQPISSSHAVNNGHNPTSVSVPAPFPMSSADGSDGFNDAMDTT